MYVSALQLLNKYGIKQFGNIMKASHTNQYKIIPAAKSGSENAYEIYMLQKCKN